MDAEPDWAKVIDAAYRSSQGVVQWKGDLPDDHKQQDKEVKHDLREETDLTDERISNAVKFGERTDLIRQLGTGMHYELKEKGLNVAHERALRSRQEHLMESQNKATQRLATFTVILGAAALVEAAASTFTAQQPYNYLLLTIYVAVLVVLWRSRDDWAMTN